jgi:hypothetical protein
MKKNEGEKNEEKREEKRNNLMMVEDRKGR